MVESSWNELVSRLSHMAISLISSRSVEELARRAESIVESMVSVDYAGIYLLAPGTSDLKLYLAPNFTEEERLEAERTAWDRHPGLVIRTGQMLHVPDVRNDPEHSTVTSTRSFTVLSRLFLPVMAGGRCVGCFGMGSPKVNGFGENERSILEFVCSLIGVVYLNLLNTDALTASEQRLDLALEGGGIGLWDWDMKTNKVYFNTMWKSMLGYAENEVEGHVRAWEKLLHPEDKKRVEEELAAHFEDPSTTYESEQRLKTKDGHWKWILDRGKVTQWDSEGRPSRMVGIHQDIDARKEMEQRLKESNEMKSAFVAQVSHELRTPLTSILGFSSTMLKNPELPIEQRGEFLGIILQESRRLAELIERVLTLSRIESKSMDLPLDEVDLVPLIRDVVQSCKLQAAERRVRLFAENLPEHCPVTGHTPSLRQVLLNLVGNAIKFNRAGGRVLIDCHEEDDFWLIELSDNGPGLPQGEEERIFERFYRVKGVNRPGSGLGLAIVREIVELHGGTVTACNNEDEGATFKVKLPCLNRVEE